LIAKLQKAGFVQKSDALFIVVGCVGGREFCREKGENAFLGAKLFVLHGSIGETASGEAFRVCGGCKRRGVLQLVRDFPKQKSQ